MSVGHRPGPEPARPRSFRACRSCTACSRNRIIKPQPKTCRVLCALADPRIVRTRSSTSFNAYGPPRFGLASDTRHRRRADWAPRVPRAHCPGVGRCLVATPGPPALDLVPEQRASRPWEASNFLVLDEADRHASTWAFIKRYPEDRRPSLPISSGQNAVLLGQQCPRTSPSSRNCHACRDPAPPRSRSTPVLPRTAERINNQRPIISGRTSQAKARRPDQAPEETSRSTARWFFKPVPSHGADQGGEDAREGRHRRQRPSIGNKSQKPSRADVGRCSASGEIPHAWSPPTIAARGIDVDGITHVINFPTYRMCPRPMSHRIGPHRARPGARGAPRILAGRRR